MAFLQKKGNVWYGVYRLKDKMIWKSLSPDKQEANDKLVDLENELTAKKYGHRIIEKTWKSFQEEYSQYSKTNKKSSTYQFDSYILKVFNEDNYIQSIQDLTPKLLEQWKSCLFTRGLKPSTINRYLGLLKAMGSKAYEWGYVPENRYLTVKPMRIIETKEDEKIVYSPDDIKKIQKSCETEYQRVLVDIAFYSGLRRSEIQNLKWEDIDFDNDIINVQSTKEWTPKSYKSRYVSLNEHLKKTLLQWRKKSKEEYVLPTNLSNKWYLSKMFKTILDNAELKGSIHDTRHTFITRLAEAGEDPLVLQKEAGHSDFKTTNKIYTHLNIKNIKTKINALPY